MIEQRTDSYIKVCMKSWLLCESCIHLELSHSAPRQELIEILQDCAKSCFAVVTRLVSNPADLGQLPLNCILDCMQCVRECNFYSGDPDIADCADACLICAYRMRDLTPFCLN